MIQTTIIVPVIADVMAPVIATDGSSTPADAWVEETGGAVMGDGAGNTIIFPE